MNDLEKIAARREQSRRSEIDRKRAADIMLKRTIMQGRKMAYDHINAKVNEIVSESWRTMARIIYPKWYEIGWIKFQALAMTVATFLFQAFRFIPATIPQRIAKIIWRGGCYGKVEQGAGEWGVVIKVFRGWKLVYKCDMDIRSGKIIEVQK